MDISNPRVGSMPRPAAGRYRLSQLLTEIGDRFTQSGGEFNFGLPSTQLTGAADVGLTPFGIILRERCIDDTASATGETNDRLGQVENGQFLWVAEIDRARLSRHQESVNTFDKVRNEPKTARRRS